MTSYIYSKIQQSVQFGATRMVDSSNAEGSKPTTVEDSIQLLTTQQRLQQEKFFEMMSTFSTALQASVPVRQPQEAALPQTTPKFEAFDSTTELWTDYWFRFSTFTKANPVPDARVAKVFLRIKRQLSTSCFPLLLLRKPRQEL